jgi:acetyl-CoA hydrolase
MTDGLADDLRAPLCALLRPGDACWWGQATAEPLTLTRALVAHRHAVAQGGRLRVFVGIGASDTLRPEHADAMDFFGYAAGGAHRALAQAGVLDILPCHYSQLPALIRAGTLPVDVALLQVAPADEQGRHNLGLAHEYLGAVLDKARVVIGEINPDIPRTTGNLSLRGSDFALLVQARHPPLDAAHGGAPGAAEQRIARHVAGWVEDGATLQLGIGNLPEAVLAALHGHRDLGLHSGAIGDGVARLAQAGVLTHARKSIDTGIGVAGLLMGGPTLRRWAHDNPALHLRATDYTHDAGVLAAIDKLTAINAALEVDLTGQINAEVAGGVYVGAVGGAVDFLRGAARSRGGLPIVALPATAKGASRLVARLSGPVSTPRSDAGLIVTEHGVADLRGQPLARRVRRLIDIAAPEHRAELDRQVHDTLRGAGVAFT